MSTHRIFTMPFASVYPAYVNKVTRKGRTKEELDEVIRWLTGYDQAGLQRQSGRRADFDAFFRQAPALHPNRGLITGVMLQLGESETAISLEPFVEPELCQAHIRRTTPFGPTPTAAAPDSVPAEEHS